MLVRLRLAGQLLGREMVIVNGGSIATNAVLNTVFDKSIGQDVLDAGAWYDPGRNAWPSITVGSTGSTFSALS
jgi:hypothetical protein